MQTNEPCFDVTARSPLLTDGVSCSAQAVVGRQLTKNSDDDKDYKEEREDVCE